MDNIFLDIFNEIPREGPGDNYFTEKAFSYINTPKNPIILDIGCGSGSQTIKLYELSNGVIYAVDYYNQYLKKLEKKINTNNIIIIQGDMKKLKFKKDFFDLIWSEGAIYIIGLEKGYNKYKEYLKRGGYMVVSHISWLKSNPPQELLEYWENNYPEINYISENIKIIEKQGFKVEKTFIIDEYAWWDNYYNPLLHRIERLKNKYINNEIFENIINEIKLEIDMYKKYSDYYGYVFYIAKKI